MGLPKYLQRKEDSPSVKGRKQEDKARKHINSGSVWFDQMDLTQEGEDRFLIDVKRTDAKSFALNREKMTLLFERAMKEQKTPAYLIYFGEEFVCKVIVERNPERSGL